METRTRTTASKSPRRILLTGARGAVGYAACELLVAPGRRVAGTMRSRGGKNVEVARSLEALGVQVVEMDVTDDASVDAGVAAILEALGGLDVVCNNAGIGSYGIQELFSADEMHRGIYAANGMEEILRSNSGPT